MDTAETPARESTGDWIKGQLASIPPATRVVCVVLLVMAALGLAIQQSESYLALNIG